MHPLFPDLARKRFASPPNVSSKQLLLVSPQLRQIRFAPLETMEKPNRGFQREFRARGNEFIDCEPKRTGMVGHW
jgi:hypothetical protein